jgi:hypothetical protein
MEPGLRAVVSMMREDSQASLLRDVRFGNQDLTVEIPRRRQTCVCLTFTTN